MMHCRNISRRVIRVMTVMVLVLTASSACGRYAQRADGAKNIIVMISDGCGYNQVDAASFYEYGRTGDQPLPG